MEGGKRVWTPIRGRLCLGRTIARYSLHQHKHIFMQRQANLIPEGISASVSLLVQPALIDRMKGLLIDSWIVHLPE